MDEKGKVDLSVVKQEMKWWSRKGLPVQQCKHQLQEREEMLKQAIEERDSVKFMGAVMNDARPLHLCHNMPLLRERGMYEEALFFTYTGAKSFAAHRPTWELLLRGADRDKLRGYGDPLPGPGPFTVYRGIAGRGPQRNVKGHSWTGTLDTARWFAGRWVYISETLSDPTVLVATVPESAVIFFTNERNEDEYVVSPESIRSRKLEKVTRERFEAAAGALSGRPGAVA